MTSRINILHVGDLHIQKSDLFQKDIVLESFLNDMQKVVESGIKPDLIIFSGDLVQGGDQESDFELAFDHFIDPLCSITGCSYERFFFAAGNHDVQRKVVNDHSTLVIGLDNTIISQDNLNHEVTKSECLGYVEKKFENFDEYAFGMFGKANLIEKQPLFSSYFIKELNLSIISINSSWLSTGGVVREDKGKLAISDIVLQKAISSVPKDSRKILVGHHPLDWLAEFNQTTINNILSRDIDLFLCGHMHETEPKHVSRLQGSVLHSQCGSLYAGGNYHNGYSILSIAPDNDHVEVSMRTYFPQRQEFDAAINLCEEGKFYSSPEAKTYWKSHPSIINTNSLSDWLRNCYLQLLYKEFDFGFYKDSLSEVYVEPVISNRPENLKYKENVSEEDADKKYFSINEIAQNSQNYIIYARREYGKTSLLQKTAIECIEGRSGSKLTIPFTINFNELKTGRNQIEKALKHSIHPEELPEDLSLEKILKLGMATIIVDDLNNKDLNKLNMLTEFINDNSNNRFILCVEGAMYEALGAAWVPQTNAQFEKIFLHCLTMDKLRLLVQKWTKAEDKSHNQKILDKILENIVQINVPRTPVIGSIFLSILDQQADFSPINRAVMIERFVETLLDKHKPDEARRETFDYRNKEHYLSFIAGKMVDDGLYSYSINDLTEITIGYLRDLALSENATEIIEYFISTRIFSEVDGAIKFKYRSMCEYFIAKQMSENTAFRNKIVNSDDYLMYQNEIECLAGIKRSDLELLQQIKAKFDELNGPVNNPDLDVFNKLNARTSEASNFIAEIEGEIATGSLDDKERDAILETEFPKDVGHRQDMRRPVYNDYGHKWAAALALYSRVVKNTEMISGALKKEYVLDVLQKWSHLTVFALAAVPILVEQKKIKINGQLYEIVLPPNMTDEKLFHGLCLSAGLGVSAITKSVIATEKLEMIFKEDLADEVPLIVEFYQNLILLHMRSAAAVSRLTKTIQKMRHSIYLMELTLVELNHVLKMRTLSNTEEAEIVKMLGLAMANIKGGTNVAKYERGKYVEDMKKKLFLGRMRKANEDADKNDDEAASA